MASDEASVTKDTSATDSILGGGSATDLTNKKKKSSKVRSPRPKSARSERLEVKSRQLISALTADTSESDEDSTTVDPVDVALRTNQMSSIGPPEILKYQRELKSGNRFTYISDSLNSIANYPIPTTLQLIAYYAAILFFVKVL